MNNNNTTPTLSSEDIKCFTQDHVIWKSFREGNEQALVYIYRVHGPALFTYGSQFTNDKELVKDNIQELFIELIKSRERLSDTDSIRYYLFKSLRRRLARAIKKEENCILSYFPGNDPDNSLSPESKYIREQSNKEQQRIINKERNLLPAKQKEAVQLYFYEGMSYKEIAGLMGMTRVKSARVLIYRAVDSLTVQLLKYKSTVCSSS